MVPIRALPVVHRTTPPNVYDPGMPLALEIGAAVVLLLAIIIIAERDHGTAGKIAQVVLVLLVAGALGYGGWWLARDLGIIGPVPDTQTGAAR